MTTMEAQNNVFRPMEGGHHNPHAVDEAVVDHEHEQHHDGGVQFSDSFGGGGVEHQPIAHTEAEPHHDDGGMMRRERKSSKDYSHTDEWDASKTVPSRFQQRKGSIFATPSSRDGHVERNLEKDAEFHKKHSKRFSFSKVKDKATDLVGTGEGSSARRRSSAGHSSSG
ncbi:uncharacterized protein PG998_004223 [Apiospora kogelbergensis]|uniref:Uncharacterized protein n=1 Tax=Apiospora kogelbergensis TaxID=1337665 RepID=A0AAW0QS90_9PEZI